MADLFLCKRVTNLANVLLVHLVKKVVELDSAVVCVKLPVLPQLGHLDQLHERDEGVFGEVSEPAGAHPSCTVPNPVVKLESYCRFDQYKLRFQDSKGSSIVMYLFTTLL